MKRMRSITRGVCWALIVSGLIAVFLGLTGCAAMMQPEKKVMVDVAGEYLELTHQRVAVMVAADAHTLYAYPDAPLHMVKAVTGQIAGNAPDVTNTVPDQVIRFQKENPYWTNLRYSELIKKMAVDKIVLIDVVEYRTHEPGNTHVWHGLITANIGVIDASAADPDNFAYYNTVSVRFPDKSTVGVVDADDESIQLGMLLLFSRKAGGLFYDHQVEVEK